MAGADTIVRLIASTLFLIVLVFVVGVGFTLADPIFNNVLDQTLMTDLGWGQPGLVVMLFMGMALIGLGLVVIIWWVVGPARDDVRQSVRGRGGF